MDAAGHIGRHWHRDRTLILLAYRHGLRVSETHTYRDHVQKDRHSQFVPAILRYNSIETRVLLELANLADPVDQQRVLDPVYRDRMGWAIYEAILEVLNMPKSRAPESISPASPGK